MRANAPRGVTVADLRQKGAAPLNDMQLRQLVAGQDRDGAQHGDQ